MHLINYTPFCGASWQNIGNDNCTYISTLCRVKFLLEKSDLKGNWNLRIAKEQDDIFIKDMHYEDNHLASVRYESDFVPFKPYTDIIVNAKSYNLFNDANWSCSVALHASDKKPLVYSALRIKSRLLYKQEPISIRYEKAKGGILAIKDAKNEIYKYDKYNPSGCGKYTKDECSVQVYYEREHLKYVPPGFGAIHRSWKSRLDYTGTYDTHWKEEQFPLLPKDFDAYYYQAAHPLLVYKGYLEGGEKVTLTQLMKESYQNSFTLPKLRFLSRVHTPTQIIASKMHLDTLVIDIDSEDTDNYHVYASWRSQVKIHDQGLHTDLIYVPEKKEENVK